MEIQNYFNQIPDIDEVLNKKYNVTENELNNMIKITKDLLKSQPHLPIEEDEILTSKIKCFLRRTKMSIQVTKQKLDLYYSIRNFNPDYYTNIRLPTSRNMQILNETGYYIPLRKPMGVARILLGRLMDNDIKKWSYPDFQLYCLNMIELMINYDKCNEQILILDMENLTLGHALSINPNDLITCFKLYEKAYPDRMAGLHYIHCPSYFRSLVQLMKSLLKPKIANRLRVHENLESLYEHIPKEYLPIEFGGYGESLEEQREKWIKFQDVNHDFIKKNIELRSIEKLREGKSPLTEIYGMEGSFRKLELD